MSRAPVTYRQGDILFEKVQSLSKVLAVSKNIVEDGVVATGEVTGHTHRIEGGTLYRRGRSMGVRVPDRAKVVHEEHDTIELPKGSYRVKGQREFNPEKNRRVAD